MSNPGWYPQPDGTERWFDGNSWTDHTRATQPTGPVPHFSAPQKKGGAFKWVALGVGGFFVLCCGGGVLMSLGASDTDTSADSSTTEVQESSATSSSPKKAQPSSKSPASKASAPKSTAKPKPSPAKTKAPAPPKPAGADIKVTAGEIIEEFDSNELAGDQKYKGKTVEVSGVVEKIDTELLDDDKYILNITDGGDFEIFSVTCHDMPTDVLSTLQVGSSIKVIGDFDDGGDLGVDLKNCKVV